MNIFLCEPTLTMKETKEAESFFESCRKILNSYLLSVNYISNKTVLGQAMDTEFSKDDIIVFFNSEDGEYEERFIRFLKVCDGCECRIWAIAMYSNPECRMPPEPVQSRQSFDVSSRLENHKVAYMAMTAVAQIFARKIISQALSPLYQDEVLYFISHKRADGEGLAARLADELKMLTRDRNVYRDVVNVHVGEEAQKDIDEHLKESDVLIFLQTPYAYDSQYIIKELTYALVHDIPILWIQVDEADVKKLQICPGEKPLLSYRSDEFQDEIRLEEIATEIEDKCFALIMNNSNHVYSYIELLREMAREKKVKLCKIEGRQLAYGIEYKEITRDRYDSGERNHYLQCYGRNLKEQEISLFVDKMKDSVKEYDRIFMLSRHGNKDRETGCEFICEENFEDYIVNLENVLGICVPKTGKRIIISGAFPDGDEIYKSSLTEAVIIYAKQIIRHGHTLVFGAHPTFQKAIFEIGELYSDDPQYSIEMHMDKAFLGQYDERELRKKCKLILSDGLEEMRKNMITRRDAEMMICIGGKIKEDKSQQGVDVEVNYAKKKGIPVVLVGTVGGRSSEMAFEKVKTGEWKDLNSLGKEFNERLFYNLNHRVLSEQLLNTLK